jgi:hypothetical protein
MLVMKKAEKLVVLMAEPTDPSWDFRKAENWAGQMEEKMVE